MPKTRPPLDFIPLYTNKPGKFYDPLKTSVWFAEYCNAIAGTELFGLYSSSPLNLWVGTPPNDFEAVSEFGDFVGRSLLLQAGPTARYLFTPTPTGLVVDKLNFGPSTGANVQVGSLTGYLGIGPNTFLLTVDALGFTDGAGNDASYGRQAMSIVAPGGQVFTADYTMLAYYSTNGSSSMAFDSFLITNTEVPRTMGLNVDTLTFADSGTAQTGQLGRNSLVFDAGTGSFGTFLPGSIAFATGAFLTTLSLDALNFNTPTAESASFGVGPLNIDIVGITSSRTVQLNAELLTLTLARTGVAARSVVLDGVNGSVGITCPSLGDVTIQVGTGGSKGLHVGGVRVVGEQQASIADATGAGDVVAQLNLALAALRAHGLIAP